MKKKPKEKKKKTKKNVMKIKKKGEEKSMLPFIAMFCLSLELCTSDLLPNNLKQTKSEYLGIGMP